MVIPGLRCPECGSTLLSWSLIKVPSNRSPATGQMLAIEMLPAIMLGCDECSETVHIIDNDEELRELLS